MSYLRGWGAPWQSSRGLRFNTLGCGFNSHPGDQYFVLVSGQLAEKLPDHNAWWTPLADGKMVLQRMLIISQLMHFRCWKILIQWDKVLPYNYRLLLVCYKQYKNSVEIEFKNTTCIA
jgi:hypothetical protein